MTIFTTRLLLNSFSNVLHLLKCLIDCHTTLFIYLFIVVKSTLFIYLYLFVHGFLFIFELYQSIYLVFYDMQMFSL